MRYQHYTISSRALNLTNFHQRAFNLVPFLCLFYPLVVILTGNASAYHLFAFSISVPPPSNRNPDVSSSILSHPVEDGECLDVITSREEDMPLGVH